MANTIGTFLKESYFNGRNGEHFKQSLYYTIEQDINANKSYITYRGYVGSVDGYAGSGSTATVSINGETVGTFSSLSSYSWDTLRGTKSVEVNHNADGTASVGYSMDTDTPWTLGDSHLEGALTLPTIPRASTPSASNTDIGSTVRINTNRASSSFTHTITVTFGNFTKTWNSVGGYVDWNTALDESTLYSKIPNSKNGTCTISCTTYNGGSNLGTKTATFKLTANETINKPTITADAVDTNKTLATGNTIQDITGDATNKTIIKYLSNVAITTTSTPKNYATLASVKVQSGDGTFATNSQDFTATFTDVATTSYSASATDSRGYTGTTDITDLVMLPYTRLSISPVRLYKTNQTANDLYAEIDGNYFKGSFNNTANVLTLSYKYKESGTSTWSSWVSLTPTISQSEDKYTFDGLIGTNFDYQKIYDFVFKVEDLAMVQTIEAQSVPGIPIIGIFEDFVEMWGEVFVYKD